MIMKLPKVLQDVVDRHNRPDFDFEASVTVGLHAVSQTFDTLAQASFWARYMDGDKWEVHKLTYGDGHEEVAREKVSSGWCDL
jgi:hypothetical protein